MCAVYSSAELRYFRLAKGVIDHSTCALRKAFKREWNYLYPSTPWQNDGTSGLQMLTEEGLPSRYSRLFDPVFSKEYQPIKDHLRLGNLEEWDVTTLVFALFYSHALSGVRSGYHWRKVKNAIHEIKEVRNTVLSHASKACISRRTFTANFDILIQAVEDLLTRSDPSVKKLKALRTETEFVTEDLVRYKELLQQDHDGLLVLERHLDRLEYKMNISAPKTKEDDMSSSEASENSKIISKFCRRMDKLERELSSPVDLSPSRSKPAIFHSARYIRLINESSSMSYNFRWKELDKFLQGFNDDVDMEMFAGIQSAAALSHQSKKDECLEVLNGLIPKALLANKYGVVLYARIKIRKAYILHDRGKDDEAMKEADEAEKMLSLGDCHEDIAEVNYAKANIILSSGKNSKEDRERILHHLNKCIHFCEEATVDKSVTVVQAKIRKALFHLGFYQHGILEEEPISSDVSIAETIFNCIADQSEPIAERSKVYLMYGQSLLAYWKGDTNLATKLENKVRRKCEQHKMCFEIQQLDMLRTLVKGMNALFGLHLQISVGETLIVGTASSTAVFLASLPAPPLLKITGRRLSAEEDKRLAEIQRQIVDTTNKNRASFRLADTVHISTPKATPPPSPSQNVPTMITADMDQDEGPKAELDLCTGPKDAYVVEVDDRKDEDVVAVLLDEPAPEGFHSCNTETLPGAISLKSGVKMIVAVQRKALSDEDIRTNQQFAKLFEDTIKSLWFKLRNMSPCCLSNIHFDIEIPEDDNIQVAVTGVAVCVEDKETEEENTSKQKRPLCDRSHSRSSQNSDNGAESDDLLFPIEEVVETSAVENMKNELDSKTKRLLTHPLTLKTKVKVPYRPAVEVTSMSYLPNTQIEQYLGNINLFLIRESHTVRENGGLNVFMQAFVAEAQAILRAHVLAIGGNALVSYQLNEIVLLDNPHKRQGQCLLNVSGDAVKVFYEEDEGLDSSGRGSPRKRTVSYSEANPHTPIQLVRQRSISASEASMSTPTAYDPFYGTEI